MNFSHRGRLLNKAFGNLVVWDVQVREAGEKSETGSYRFRCCKVDILPQVELPFAILQIAVMGQLMLETSIVGAVGQVDTKNCEV